MTDPASATGRWLDVQLLEGIAPLDGQSRFSSDSCVPEGLEGILFDPQPPDPDPVAGPPRGTFAVLDAAACAILPEMLGASGLRHKCLFTGKAEDEMADAAPWLVELTPDNDFTRQLMSTTDSPGGLWELDLGIILKSTMGFDALWTHCRKFTRIQNEAGKWLYNRYWAPPVSTRAMAFGNRPELVQFVSPFFPRPEDDAIDVLLLNSDIHALLSRIPGTEPPAARPVLTEPVQQTLRQIRRAQQYEELIDITLPHVSGKSAMSDAEVREHLRARRDWYFETGFWQRDHLAKMMTWEVMLGPDFVETYGNGTIMAILTQATAPYEAIMNIEFFLEAEEIRRQGGGEPPAEGGEGS